MLLTAPLLLAAKLTFAAEAIPAPDTLTMSEAAGEVKMEAGQQAYIDSIEGSFTYQHGRVELSNGVAGLDIPKGFKFLDQQQSADVIVGLWGNPDADGVLGMVLPEEIGVLSDGSYAFVVQYDEMGYVKDDDADDVDYDELAEEMKSGEAEHNAERAKNGYEPMYFIGWATKPFYDKEHKVLHWAKEIKFGDSTTVNTLNYNVRVLGRKGVLVLNAVSTMNELALVQQHIPDVLEMVQFNDGFRYEQFDSKVDDVAAWTIGGLVAGKVLAKAGILALVLKNIKLVLIALAAAGAGIFRFFGGKKKKKEEEAPAPVPPSDALPPATGA
ncbi:MAG TPA: DUF2167 domain-containing protein [Flavobacteriales bacterium]